MKIEIDYEDAVLLRSVLAFCGNLNAYRNEIEETRAIRLSTRIGEPFDLITPEERRLDAEIEELAKELGI